MAAEHKFIDTNILVYAELTDDSRKHELAVKLIESLLREGSGVISIQVLVELSAVLEKNGVSALRRNEIVGSYFDAFKVLSYSVNEIRVANLLSEKTRRGFFDSLIVANMDQGSIDVILTENKKDFRSVEGLKAINPFE